MRHPSQKIFLLFLFCTGVCFTSFGQPDSVSNRSLKVNKKDVAPWGNTYALVIGISNYKNITQLNFADDDAESVRDFLVNTKIVKSPGDVQLLIDSTATKAQIYGELSKISAKVKAGDNDRVFIYFAGHGDNDMETEQGYLLAYGCTDTVAYYDNDAVFIPLLESIINGIAKKAKVILITDACRSGNLAGHMDGALRTMKALNEGFTNTIKILSCKPGQLSQEKYFPGGGHGVFTEYLLQSLYGLSVPDSTKDITISDVDDYVTKKVSDETGKEQRPVLIYNKDEVIAKVDPEMRLAALSQQGKGNGNIVTRNIKSFNLSLSPDDSVYFKKFYAQLRAGKLNTPKGNNAYETYKKATATVKNPDLLNSMKYDLAAKLEDAVQPLLNRFIRAEFQDYPDSLFTEANNKLKIVQDELMDTADFRYNEIKAKRIFFIASIHKTPRALDLLRLADSLMPNSTFINFEIGRYFSEVAHLPDSSLKYLQKAIRLSPRWSYPRFMIGNIYYRSKEYNRASVFYNQALELQPKFAYALFNLALTYKQLKQKDSADFYYQKALLLDKSFEQEWGSQRKTEDEIVSLGKTIRNTDVDEDQMFAGLLPPGVKKQEQTVSNEAREAYTFYSNGYYQSLDGNSDSALYWYNKAAGMFEKAYSNKTLPLTYYYTWGYTYQVMGKYEKAKETYKLALQKDTADFDLYYFGIGWITDKDDKPAEAMDWYKKAVTYNPKYYQASNNLGWAFARLKNKDSAIYYYQQALAVNPRFTTTIYNLATLYFDGFNDDSAIFYNRKLLSLLPKPDATVYNRLGISYDYIGKTDSAIACYEKAIALEPKEPVYYRNIGNTYYNSKQYTKAIQYYEQGNALMADSNKTYFNLALSYANNNDFEKAANTFKQSLAKQKKIESIYLYYYNLGWVLDKQKKLDEALYWYKKTVETNPGYPNGLNNLGFTYDRLGKYDSAITWYRKAYKADPTYTRSLYNLAVIYNDLYKYDSSVYYYKLLQPLVPDDATVPYEIGLSYYYKSQFDSAAVFMEKAISLDHTNAGYIAKAGDIYFDAAGINNDNPALYKESVTYYKEALRLDSAQYLAMNRLGVAYIYLGDFNAGINIFEMALKKDAVYKNTYEYNLACIYSLQKDKEKALVYFKQSLESGYRDLAHISEDTDLDHIRSLPAFKTIIEKYFKPDEILKYTGLYGR